jgi:hypothetical protein
VAAAAASNIRSLRERSCHHWVNASRRLDGSVVAIS